MGKKLGNMIDACLENGGVINTRVEYEVCKEFVVPTYKNILRMSRYALSEEMSDYIGYTAGEYEPLHFGWMENRRAEAVYPAHMMTVIRVADKYYYIPTALLGNVEKSLSVGETKVLQNFEETNWIPKHIALNNKEEFGNYLIFRDKISDKLKNSVDYIVPGAGITQFIYRDEMVETSKVDVVKIKDGDIYTYFIKDNRSNIYADLGACESSDVADNIIMDDGEIFKIELDITRLAPKLYSFGEYIVGREIKIPSTSKRDLNVLVKAIQDNTVTMSQLEKFETITGIGHKIMASEEISNCVFLKFPTTSNLTNIISSGRIKSVDVIRMRNGVHIASSNRVLEIISRMMTDTYTVEDYKYVLENAIN